MVSKTRIKLLILRLTPTKGERAKNRKLLKLILATMSLAVTLTISQVFWPIALHADETIRNEAGHLPVFFFSQKYAIIFRLLGKAQESSFERRRYEFYKFYNFEVDFTGGKR